MKSSELRKHRDLFRKSKQHEYLSEANIITPSQDATSLFNTSGMQQLIPYLAGKPHKQGKRLYNIQKCLRTVDIDEVGDRSHLTFFEMMGNRSLGDYFKKEAIFRSREFLTKSLQFDPKKLAVTVFEGDENAPKDEESYQFRIDAGISADKISFLPAKHNRRSPGPVGPCGSDTEIFYRVGDRRGAGEFPSKKSNVKDDEDNRMEIWNNVFMEFYRDETGTMSKLKQQNVDTGMGFERMSCVLQGKDTVYETDLFAPFIAHIEKSTGEKYDLHQKKMRIICDHLRTACVMIQDGAICSNVGSGYILRMIIRRMYYNLFLLHELENSKLSAFLKEGIAIFSEINRHRNFPEHQIFESLDAEIKHFKTTLSNGLQLLKSFIADHPKEKVFPGTEAFKLYDTFGFPIEISKEICEGFGRKIDLETYEKELEKAKERSRKSTEKMFDKGIDRSKYLDGIEETTFIGYDQKHLNLDEKACKTQKIKILKDFDVHGQRVLILNCSPFYAESGGQTGDIGNIELDSGEKLKINSVKKYEGVFLHFVG